MNTLARTSPAVAPTAIPFAPANESAYRQWRELKLRGAEGLAPAFDDVSALAERCRFRDCRHDGEPGCAVIAAVEAGALPARRVEALHKLAREAEALAARRGGPEAQARKQRWKVLHEAGRRWALEKRRGWDK